MSEHDRPAAHARVRRHLLAVLALCAASIVLTPAEAAAQACGGANEPACTAVECAVHGLFGNCLINRTIYSCDSSRLNVTLTLQGRVCRPCGAAGEPACSGGFCVAGTRNVAGFCASCGAAGQPACSGGVCNAGTRNLLGICTACGGAEEIVCSGGTCDEGHQGVQGICKPCGSPGEVACNGVCEAGARNVLGMCRACGDAGELVCDVGEACRDTEGRTNVRGVGDLAVCVACGGLFQPECDEAPACLPQLNAVLNRCVLADCGGDGQPQCSEGEACEPRHEPRLDLGLGIALCRSCGGAGEQQCSEGEACDPRHEPILDLGLGIALCRPCGGHGEQQCSEEKGPACDARHEPLLNPFGGFEVGRCFECGGEDQQACRNLPACDRPFHNIRGECRARESWVAEPDCNCTVVPQAVAEGTPVWGFADLHAHQFANLGFGGTQFSGSPWDPDGITFALPACGFTEDFATVGPLGEPTASIPLTGVPIHGPLHALDPLGLAAGNSLGLSNFGVTPPPVLGLPDPSRSFEGWPKWSSPNHQRMYYKWLERAWKGGLRLMIVQAVNNEVSCRTGATRSDPVYGDNPWDPVAASLWGCNDMDAVDRQIQAARDLEEAIDVEAGGTGLGWYRIVTSAAQARQVMSQGKLAVVLGIEVDSLFDCQRGFCTEADVDAELQRYYDLGVRHAYPIHLFNNDFGGTTHYFDAFNVANFAVTGSFIQSYDCSAEGFAFQGAVSANQDLLLGLFLSRFGFPAPLPTGNAADCNQLGLTALGEYLVRRMIDKRMFIDLDHLSFRGVNAVLDIAESEQYPVLATHVGLLDLKEGGNRSERYWTAGQLQRVRDLGGVVAPILIPGEVRAHQENGAPVIANDCKGSSKEWVQSYLAAVQAMSGSSYLVGVGYGSDFNGMTQALAPRFETPGTPADETDACEGDTDAGPQGSRVTYPFNAHGTTGTFEQQVTGGRTFDYNEDGVAHVGLIPDFVEDLKRIGLTDQQLEPFFRSAEAFLQMWERIDARGTAPPRTTASVSPSANAAGWHNAPVTVALNAVSQVGGGAVASIAYSTAGAVTQPLVDAPGNAVSLTLAADGETTLFFRARAAGGAVEPQQSRVFRIDRTVPAVTALVAPEPNPAGWHRGNVTVTLHGTDMGSGVAGCDGPFVLTGEGAELSASGTCSDNAGNVSATNEVSGIRIDRAAPALNLPGPLTAVSPGAGGVAVAFTVTASDALSGPTPPSCTRESGSVFPLGTTTVDCTAADVAGNLTTGSFTVTVTAGAPKLSTLIAAKGRDAIGFWMDVRVTNSGTGHASAVFLGPLSFRTLSGTGTVSYDAGRSGALPLSVGEVNVGESRTVRLYLNVPTSVLRFSMTASGTLQNAIGASSSFSFAQSVIP